MSEIDGTTFKDLESGDEAYMAVRVVEQSVGLTVSLRADGDVEVFLGPEELDWLMRTLQEARQRLDVTQRSDAADLRDTTDDSHEHDSIPRREGFLVGRKETEEQYRAPTLDRQTLRQRFVEYRFRKFDFEEQGEHGRAWRDPTTGIVYTWVCDWVPDEESAIELAREREVIAVYDQQQRRMIRVE